MPNYFLPKSRPIQSRIPSYPQPKPQFSPFQIPSGAMPSQPPQMSEGPSHYPEPSKGGNGPVPQQWHINQEVEVCIRANCWVVGIVIGVVHCLDRFTGGGGYKITYIQPSSAQRIMQDFPPDRVRPHCQ